MSVYGSVLKGIILVVVIMVLTTIAAQDFKELTFAEDEWEELTESLDAFNAEDILDPLEEPTPFDQPGTAGGGGGGGGGGSNGQTEYNCETLGDRAPRGICDPGSGGIVIPDWLAGIPVISNIVEATAAVASAIWSGVLAVVDFLQKGSDALLALGRFLFAIATFDIPALNAHPALIMIRFIIVLPLWVGIPYLFVRMIRGGG